MQLKRVAMWLVLLFAVVYYVGRIGIFVVGVSGDMQFEEEQSEAVEAAVLYSFLAIGIAGLAMLPGVYLKRFWGFWGTIAVSLYTIVFDIWAFVGVQSSAAAGVIPAAVIMAYLLLVRNEYLKRTG